MILPQHLLGQRIDAVSHACPDCPAIAPSVFCPYCLGTGLVDEPTLGRWQREAFARNA